MPANFTGYAMHPSSIRQQCMAHRGLLVGVHWGEELALAAARGAPRGRVRGGAGLRACVRGLAARLRCLRLLVHHGCVRWRRRAGLQAGR